MRKLKKTIDSAVREARRDVVNRAQYRVRIKMFLVEPSGRGHVEEVSLPCRLDMVRGQGSLSAEIDLVSKHPIMVQSGAFSPPLAPLEFMVMP